MANAISVQNLSKRYRLGEVSRMQLVRDLHRWWKKVFSAAHEEVQEVDDFWALQNVSFDIARGETVGIIGANGAGKSTLLKILSRITMPTSGKIALRGRVGSLLEVGTGFNPELTGRDNVYLNGAILGMSRNEIRTKFDEIVEFADLGDFIDTPVKRYSSGMYVRLAFSVASSLRPEILILDEVLAVGDAAFRQKCFARVEELVKSGHTILFVAHDSGSVLRFCNRVIWLENGRVKYDGDAEIGCEMYRAKQTREILSAPKENGIFKISQDVDRTGSGYFRLHELVMAGCSGKPTVEFKCGEECNFTFKYLQGTGEIPPIKDVHVGLVIQDEQGRRVVGLRSDFVGKNFVPFPSDGVVRCRLPKMPFTPGNYTVTCALSINKAPVDGVISAGRFVVREGDFFGSGTPPLRAMTPVCVENIWE